jgi:hypothetical protein
MATYIVIIALLLYNVTLYCPFSKEGIMIYFLQLVSYFLSLLAEHRASF